MKIEHNAPHHDHLRAFLTIAECGNLTHAAERLGRTQAAISVQVRKLEDDLGAPLFERTSRGMTLTENGRRLRPMAQSVLADLRQIGALFQGPLRGRIRVGIPDDFDDNILEKALAAFMQTHGEVEVIAQSGCTSGYPAAIRTGALDIAVCSGPAMGDGAALRHDPCVWAAAAAFEVRADAPVPLALLDRSCWWRDIPADALAKAGMRAEVTFRTASFPSLKAALRAGLAIGVLPKSSVEPGMRILTKRDGFPDLPISHRFILTSQTGPQDLCAAMAAALNDAADGIM